MKERIKFVGLRGSSAFGLRDEQSDYDILVISNKEEVSDIQYMTLSQFDNLFYQGDIATVTAILNPLYVSRDFRDSYEHYLKELENFNELLKNSIFLMTKNNIKRIEKKIMENIFTYDIINSTKHFHKVVDSTVYKDLDFLTIKGNSIQFKDKIDDILMFMEKEGLIKNYWSRFKRDLTSQVERIDFNLSGRILFDVEREIGIFIPERLAMTEKYQETVLECVNQFIEKLNQELRNYRIEEATEVRTLIKLKMRERK